MGFQRVIPTMLLLTAVVAGCSSPPVSPPAPTTLPASPDLPERQALTAYENFWTVTDAAYAAPKSRDWIPQLREVATGQALETARADVENYASFPAHSVGAITRSPALGRVSDQRIEILDCVDLGDSRLVSDANGDALDDLANRVPRYRFRAELVKVEDHWFVERTVPLMSEPC